jgi:hypothetical protein
MLSLPEHNNLVVLHETTAEKSTKNGRHNFGHVGQGQLVAGRQALGQKLGLAAQRAQEFRVKDLKYKNFSRNIIQENLSTF